MLRDRDRDRADERGGVMRRFARRVLGLGLGLCLCLVFVGSEASADESVTTIKTTTVYGRAGRPNASIEVSRARMQLPVTTPTLASVTKIQDASKRAPF